MNFFQNFKHKSKIHTMSQKIIFSLLIFILAIPLVSAKDIILSLEQSEYYFKTGENAIINLQSENNYKEQINGMLSYTITQSINQGNFQYSSTNMKSTSFSINQGKTQTPINFGTSDTPIVLDIDLQFSYTKNKSKSVNLNNIKIHFINKDSQKNNQQNQISSSSQETSQETKQQNNPFTQQQQRMQQMTNQIFGQEQQQPQRTEQRLQNNQLSQDSSALKQQMQNQFQEQQQMKEEFQKELAQNQEFQKEHQELLNQGYNLTNAKFNPSSNNTGDFELEYQNQKNEQATLLGQMNNSKIQNIQKNTAESRQQILNELQENKQFQKYHQQLQDQGYSQQNTQFYQEQNKTNVQLNYFNENNETASIMAEIMNNTIQNVELKNGKKEKKNYWQLLIIISLITILSYFAYKKIHKKSKPEKSNAEKKTEKPFDYKKESLLLLQKSKKLFEKEEYKDAYGAAGQALRLYLSYENKLNKEITNDEIIDYLKKHKKNYKEAKECFDLCSLVEFAKYEANKKDFNKIIKIIEKHIL
ncbi:MAG: hypothetical protein ACLFN8_01690 [Candidatus Woesearchaeota archaeon]